MARNRFQNTDTHKIPLSDGDWIEVKKDLNNGDSQKLSGAGMKDPIRLASGELITPIDWERYEIERAAIFLTDWSFRDAEDKPMRLRKPNGEVDIDMIKALTPEDFDEMNKAIYNYVLHRAVEKNALKAQPKEEAPVTGTTSGS